MASRSPWDTGRAGQPGYWTENAFLRAEEIPDAELVDGSLVVTPHGTAPHQRLTARLLRVFEDAAPVGYEVLSGVNIRLRRGRILVPDIVVLSRAGLEDAVLEAGDVALVCEISAPAGAATDRLLKLNLYAQAAIPRYLLIDLDDWLRTTATMFELSPDGTYLPADAAMVRGRILSVDTPFRVSVDLARLARSTRPVRRPHTTRPRPQSRTGGSPRLRGVRTAEEPE